MLTVVTEILELFANLVITVVIAQFILSLLIAFNIVNLSSNFVSALWQSLNAILDPVLKPIRRIMPDTGMIDFSPIVLIFGLQALMIILENLKGSRIL